MLYQAITFACDAHKGQRRKWTDEPYITHPLRVMSRVLLLPNTREEMATAAVLHDVIEDCNFSLNDINKFGNKVTELVDGLTNPSKGSKEPRAVRKQMDREHLAMACPDIQTIKAIDRLDNLMDITHAPVNFQRLYLLESKKLCMVLDKADKNILEELKIVLDNNEQKQRV